tara:strand:+ start:4063 stop:5727 length:1665 start_codon:yes stop_codon:yes gene_type:complete
VKRFSQSDGLTLSEVPSAFNLPVFVAWTRHRVRIGLGFRMRLRFLICCICLHLGLLAMEGATNIYFRMAQEYADTMINEGRDRYGERHSPSFVDTIDLRTMRMPQETSKRTLGIYSGLFRAADSSTGCNPMYHIDLHQLLENLTIVTGKPMYRQSARDSIEWFFKNTQSEVTGFVAWGEHLAWDLIVDRVTLGSVQRGEFRVSDIHEFYGPWIHWDTTCKLAPKAALKFAKGLWDHQVYDQKTCEFSRHANYSKHGPRKGYEFARQIGFYLDTWASVYAATKDDELLVPIRQFLKALRRWQHPESGLIRFEGKSPQVAFILHNLALAVDGREASTKLPDPLKSDLQKFIRSIDEAVLDLKFDLRPDGKGFPKIADTATGEVTNAGMRKARPNYPMAFINQRYAPYGGLWASVYGAGSYTDARHALLCAYRDRQQPNERYRDLVLATADRYLGSEPSAPGYLTPKTIAPVMALLHVAWHISKEDKYLQDSRRLADHSRKLFFDGDKPLPYSSERRQSHPYYTSVSYGDSLMLMFFELGLLLDGQQVPTGLQCSIR